VTIAFVISVVIWVTARHQSLSLAGIIWLAALVATSVSFAVIALVRRGD